MSAQGKEPVGSLHSLAGSRATSGSGSGDDVAARLARLEEAVVGIKDRMTMLLAAVAVTMSICGILLAALLAAATFTNGRLDRLSDKVDALPGKIDTVTQALATAITAAKQQPPQVVLIPSPNTNQPKK